ncbi:MAG: hypothetical protein V1798_05245 [Pseudomonadota bacterium]
MRREAHIVLLGLFLAGSVFAGENRAVGQNEVLRIGPPAASQMPTKAEMREFLRILVERDLANRIAAGMDSSGFNTSQIEEVLTSAEFKKFAYGVSHHPRIVRAMDRLSDRFINPEAMRKLRLRAREEEAAAQALALRGAVLMQRMATTPARTLMAKGFMDQVWERAKRFLFE